jgi:hypothetical protein
MEFNKRSRHKANYNNLYFIMYAETRLRTRQIEHSSS